MTNKLKKYKKGFTLVETLIAIFVLMLSITGPLTLAAKGLQATLIAKDQDTAFYLAQDAVEYVRWVRDTNQLGRPGISDWLAGLDAITNGHTNSGGLGGNCTTAAGCTVDSIKDTATVCSGTCPALQYDSTENYFSYTSGTASIFTRTVKIATPVGTNAGEASVTVTVSWRDPQTHSITVREDIFNWQ